MHPLIKLCLALALLTAFIIVVCVIFMNSLPVQIISFAFLSLWICFRWRIQRWLAELKVLTPFMLTLLVVYLLFGFLRVRTASGASGDTAYWLSFGIPRVLLLVNSVLAVQVFFSLVSFDDVLRLPLKISILKYVILGKLLYAASFSSHQSIVLHQRLIPDEQQPKLSLKHRFNAKLASVLALLYFIIGESRLKGELIDNRIAHCHPEEKR